MALDPESLSMLRQVLLASAAAFAIAKISRHCSSDGLRRRLRTVDLELFEYARLGHIEFQDPAYLQLRNSLRSLIWAAQDFSLTRATMAVLQGYDIWRPANLELQAQAWDEALAQVADLRAKAVVAALHERMLHTVRSYLALGAIPFATWLYLCVGSFLANSGWLAAPLRRAGLPRAYTCALSGLPHH